MKSSLPEKIAFIDVETTGGNYLYDRIIEIGILKLENNKLVKTFDSLINPNQYLPPEITRLTGILPQELENAPTFNQKKDEILAILEDSIFAAHNARFDYGFIKNEFRFVNRPP